MPPDGFGADVMQMPTGADSPTGLEAALLALPVAWHAVRLLPDVGAVAEEKEVRRQHARIACTTYDERKPG